MKYFKYLIVNRTNVGTEEEPVWEESFYEKKMPYAESREEIAKAEAYNGEYTIEDDGVYPYPTAPHNILEGEYVTINGVMYKAIANIPNGEPIIVGQNAIETTIEEQLHELTKGE